MSARDFDRVQVQLGMEPRERVAAAAPGTPFRIAVLGDFSARASRDGARPRDVADRSPILIDRDNLDDVIARITPELHLRPAEGEEPEILRVTGLDDLHPDSLFDRLPSLGALRSLRARVADPATSRRAIQQLLGETSATGPAAHAAPVSVPSGGSLLEQIVTEAAGPGTLPPVQPAPAVEQDQLSRFVRQVVAGHIVDPGDPRQAEVLAGLDAAIAGRMRAVLHDPAFQALEALWRGVYRLVRRLDTGPDLKVSVLDVTRAELAADLAGDTPLETTGLYRLLVEDAAIPGAAPWALLVGCYGFGSAPDDVALLGRLGEIARAAGAPWVSAAEAPLAGYASFEATPEPEAWSAPSSAVWDALRRRPEAASIGLVAPRFLLRLPYGSEGDECERFSFEELGPAPEHEHFLWGNGALVAAMLLGESFTDDGWGMRPGSRSELDGLPLHVMRVQGEARAVPCAEALMPERTAALIMEAGIMPLASLKEGDAVRLVRFQSIASPLAALAGRWRGDRR